MQVKERQKSAVQASERTTAVLERLYPSRSILADIVALAKNNTDLPPSAALLGAYSRLSGALAQAGFTVRIEADAAVSPNLQIALLVGDDADPAYLQDTIVQGVLRTPALYAVASGMTTASFFAHARGNVTAYSPGMLVSSAQDDSSDAIDSRCLSMLTVINGEDWLRAIHAESSLGKLRRQLTAACRGERLHQWTKKGGDEYTAPVHLSILLASRQSPFFSELAGLFFSSSLVQQFLIVLADDRPRDRRPLYTGDGIAAAQRTWLETWSRVVAGPRHYNPSAEAISEYSAWWLGQRAVRSATDLELRRVGRAAWKYALVVQVLLNPNGMIGVPAIQIALAIADRHLADHILASKKLAWETTDERLARKIGEYIVANPKASRGKVMNNVRGASDPAGLNRALTRIAEMHAGTALAERALDLRAAARSIGNGDASQSRS